MYTRQDVVTAVQNDSGIKRSIDTSKAYKWLNEYDRIAYSVIMENDAFSVMTSQVYTSNGALPSDFRTMNADQCGVFDEQGNPINRISIHDVNGRGFYLLGGSIYLVNISYAKVYYIPKISPATEWVGTSEIQGEEDSGSFETAMFYVMQQFAEDQKEPDIAILAKSNYEERYKLMVKYYQDKNSDSVDISYF